MNKFNINEIVKEDKYKFKDTCMQKFTLNEKKKKILGHNTLFCKRKNARNKILLLYWIHVHSVKLKD